MGLENVMDCASSYRGFERMGGLFTGNGYTLPREAVLGSGE